MVVGIYIWFVVLLNGVVVDVSGPMPTSLGECHWLADGWDVKAHNGRTARCVHSFNKPRIGDWADMLR